MTSALQEQNDRKANEHAAAIKRLEERVQFFGQENKALRVSDNMHSDAAGETAAAEEFNSVEIALIRELQRSKRLVSKVAVGKRRRALVATHCCFWYVRVHR
jgi:hypothetical protein